MPAGDQRQPKKRLPLKPLVQPVKISFQNQHQTEPHQDTHVHSHILHQWISSTTSRQKTHMLLCLIANVLTNNIPSRKNTKFPFFPFSPEWKYYLPRWALQLTSPVVHSTVLLFYPAMHWMTIILCSGSTRAQSKNRRALWAQLGRAPLAMYAVFTFHKPATMTQILTRQK